MPPRTELLSTESEPHPEYPESFKVAIQLIDALKEPLSQIEELRGSPLFPASQAIAKQFRETRLATEEAPTIRMNETMLPASGAKHIFSSDVWQHFGNLASANVNTLAAKGVAQALKLMESSYIGGLLKPVHFFLLTLSKEGRQARENEEYNQNNIARMGGVHALELTQIPDKGYQSTAEHAETLQIALAQSLVQYLLNQKDMGGHTPDQIPIPDQDYSSRTRITARKILDHLKTNGWSGIANPSLAKKLDEQIVWPNDLDKPLPYATHDYNLQKDQNGKDIIVDPKIKFDETTGYMDLSGLSTQIFSLDVKKTAQTDIKSCLLLSGKDIYNQIAVANSSRLKWENYPTKLNDANLPQTHFAISLSVPGRPELEGEILNHRANHGRIAQHIHLVIGHKSSDSLIQFTSHTPKDGQAANADMDAIAKSLGIASPDIMQESIKVNPFYPNTNSVENQDQAKLENSLGLTDVEIGLNFDSQMMEENLAIINDGLISPVNKKISKILRSHSAFEAIRKIDGIPHNLNSIRQLHADVIKILNPNLNRHTLLGLIMEQDGPTTNCVFPVQKYARLTFSLFKNIKNDIQNLINPGSESDRPNFKSIEDAIRLSLTDQTMARLGLSPLGFLAVYSSQSQGLAQGGAELLARQTKEKTDILFQISELRKGLSSSFTSALSRFVKSISGGIGLINNRLTARVDLTNNNLLKRIDFDPGETIPLLYGDEVPLSLDQKKLLKSDFVAIQEVAADLHTWIDFEFHISRPSSRATFADCVSILKERDHYNRYLLPHGVDYDKIDSYLQIIVAAASYKHFSNRKNEWELFSSKLADHYAKKD